MMPAFGAVKMFLVLSRDPSGASVARRVSCEARRWLKEARQSHSLRLKFLAAQAAAWERFVRPSFAKSTLR